MKTAQYFKDISLNQIPSRSEVDTVELFIESVAREGKFEAEIHRLALPYEVTDVLLKKGFTLEYNRPGKDDNYVNVSWFTPTVEEVVTVDNTKPFTLPEELLAAHRRLSDSFFHEETKRTLRRDWL